MQPAAILTPTGPRNRPVPRRSRPDRARGCLPSGVFAGAVGHTARRWAAAPTIPANDSNRRAGTRSRPLPSRSFLLACHSRRGQLASVRVPLALHQLSGRPSATSLSTPHFLAPAATAHRGADHLAPALPFIAIGVLRRETPFRGLAAARERPVPAHEHLSRPRWVLRTPPHHATERPQEVP